MMHVTATTAILSKNIAILETQAFLPGQMNNKKVNAYFHPIFFHSYYFLEIVIASYSLLILSVSVSKFSSSQQL